MGNILIVAALVAICAYAVYSYGKKLRRGGGCCGEHEATPKKVRVSDRNKSHYPYQVRLSIDGMTCGNCAQRVENALNQLDGVWATVDLGENSARVLLKQEPDTALLRKAVRDVGYTVLSVRKEEQHN